MHRSYNLWTAWMVPLALIAAPLVAAAAPLPDCGGSQASPTAVMEKVFAHLAHRSLEARFCQRYTDVVTGERPEECGHVWTNVDGKLRCAYEGSSGKLFVFDGHTAFFLEPEAAQMTLIENFAHTPMAQALAVLWGHGSWRGVFAFAPGSQRVGGKNERSIKVTAVHAKDQVADIDVVVDTAACEVVRSRVTDPLGNITSYVLSERKRGPALPSSLFKVATPAGFSVLRAPTGSGAERQSHRPNPTKRAGDVDRHHGIQLIEGR